VILGHLAIGAGVYSAVSGPIDWKWYPGTIATGAVAGFKESADAIAGRDTKKQAVIHALTILAGAGAVAIAKH
jgi:hypothetical protein